MSDRRYFSPAEWEVLQHITARHPVTAREVADHFARSHGWVRTTVLTLIDRLRRKGYLTREKIDGVHRYAPREPGNELMLGLVRDFVQKALGGSVSPFVAYLGREARLNQQERDELKRLVRELDAHEEQGDE